MNQRYMLDTNTVSYIVKRKSLAARAKLADLQANQIACISSITDAELQYGLAKSSNAKNLCTSLEWFLARIQTLPWGREEARAYGPLRAKQEATGKTLGSMDMLIAAHAIAVSAILVTTDKALSHVPDLLATENWASDLK